MRPGLLFAVLLALLACAPLQREARAPSGEGFHFQVATFNVYHPAWKDSATLEAVSETGADVVFLQEVNPNWERVLEHRYHSEYPHMLFKAAGGASGLGVLSRFPLEDNGVLPGLQHPAWLVQVRTPGGTFPVLNLHLRALSMRNQSLLRSIPTTSRDHQREIRAFLEQSKPRPALIVGDFNEGPGGAAVRWLKERGFTNALPLYQSGHTWRSRSMGGVFKRTIDHILFDESLDALDAWVLRRGNSDHWPVVLRVQIRCDSSCSRTPPS